MSERYQFIRDLIDKVKKIEQEKNIERHSDGNYITLKNDPSHIWYCSTCWGNVGKLIQLQDLSEFTDLRNYYRCPSCKNRFILADNNEKI